MAASTSSLLSSFSTVSRSTSSRRGGGGGRALAPATRVNFRPQFSVSASCAATSERPQAMAASSSLYDVLGIQAGARCQEIKLAYRSLARVLHPDVASDCSGREFMRVHEAYATLSDPQKRADYDRALFTRRRCVAPPFSVASARSGSGFSSGYSRRRWETDQCW